MDYYIYIYYMIFAYQQVFKIAFCDEPSVLNEQDGYKILLEDYNPEVRPLRNSSHAVNVAMYASLTQLRKLDELNEELHTNIQLYVMWIDEFLNWDLESLPLDEVKLPADKVWTPQFELINSLRDDNEEDIPLKKNALTVHHSGLVISATTYRLKSSCSVDLWNFPFDNQQCNLVIHLNAPNRYYSLRVASENGVSDKSNAPSGDVWTDIVFEQNVEVHLNPFDEKLIPIDIFTIKINMIRSPAFYVIYLVVPSILMAFLSVLVFLLPPESGERIGLSITVLLSYTVFLLMVSDFTPRGGRKTPFLAYYITFIEVISGLSLFLTVIVLRVHNHEPEDPLSSFLSALVMRKKHEKNPWHEASYVLDLIFFWITLALVILLTIALLIIMLLPRGN